MTQRRIKQTTILTRREIGLAVEGIRKMLGPEIMSTLSSHSLGPRDHVRYHPVGASCREARERRGVTVRDVARQLRVPQYRIRAVENASLREIEPTILKQYAGFLKLDAWLARWVRANPDLARRLGVRRGGVSEGSRTDPKSRGRNLTTA